MVWCETSKPDMDQAKQIRRGRSMHRISRQTAGLQLLAVLQLESQPGRRHHRQFQRELGAMGYKFQFVTLAGFHALNLGMFDLALIYRKEGMLAYSNFQQEEFEQGKKDGYMATTHQKFVGTGYFDRLIDTISGGDSSMSGSTEEDQFK
jgi:isocitrate lyase